MKSKGLTFLPFLRSWILKENANMRPRREFVNARVKGMSETCRTKDLKQQMVKRVVRI